MVDQSAYQCDFCGSSNAFLVYKLRDLRLNHSGQWDLMQCDSCGLMYIFPQPDWNELQKHYPRQYHAYIKSDLLLSRLLKNYGLKKRANSILKYFRNCPGKILDIGCGTGEFLYYFGANTQWEVVGLEVVKEAAEIARQKNLKVYNRPLLEVKFPDESFDVITMWDVLEHTPNPSSVLLEVFRILKSKGLLVIKSPDPSGLEAKIFKSNWAGFEAPQHLFGFPKIVLERKLSETGFIFKAAKQTGSDYAAFFLSIGYWLQSNGATNVGKLLVKYVHTNFGRIIAGCLIGQLRFLGIKSSCTYYLLKNVKGER